MTHRINRILISSSVAIALFGLMITSNAQALDCDYAAVCAHTDEIKCIADDLRSEFKDHMRKSGVYVKLQVRIVRLKSQARKLNRKARSERDCNWHKHVVCINETLCELDSLVQHATFCAAQDPKCCIGSTQCIQSLVNQGYNIVQYLMIDTCMNESVLRMPVPYGESYLAPPASDLQFNPGMAPGSPTPADPLYKPVLPTDGHQPPAPAFDEVPMVAPDSANPTPTPARRDGARSDSDRRTLRSSVLSRSQPETFSNRTPELVPPMMTNRYQGSIRAATHNELRQSADLKPTRRSHVASRKKNRRK